MAIPEITLNDQTTIPQLGFGVFQVPPAETERVVTDALEVGYRHLDTAQMYGNEEGVGAAIAASGLPREELYVTTKLNNGFHRPDDARRTFAGVAGAAAGSTGSTCSSSTGRCPGGTTATSSRRGRPWSSCATPGRATSVGVSNFQPAHLDRIVEETGVVPAVNQIEAHPYFPNEAARAADARHGIATEAWSPIARGRVAEDPRIIEIAESVGRTPAQVTLRWHLQRGDIVFPKSMRPERMRENFALFDFELGERRPGDALVARRGRARPHRPQPGPLQLDPQLTRHARVSSRRHRRAGGPSFSRRCGELTSLGGA